MRALNVFLKGIYYNTSIVNTLDIFHTTNTHVWTSKTTYMDVASNDIPLA